MARLFSRLLFKNTSKQVPENIEVPVKTPVNRPEVPFRNIKVEKVPVNRYKLVGTFWAIGIPSALTLFYFLQLQVEKEKKFYYKQIRDEIRQETENQ